jgi:hypothetical protein
MKPATGLVLLLVVVIVLYFVALGMGLALNDRDDDRRSSGGGEGWEAALGKVTASFAPRLELGGIVCNGQPVRQPFRLTESSAQCEMAFLRSLRHDYRKAELEVVTAPQSKELAVFVRAKFSKKQLRQQHIEDSMCLPIVLLPGAPVAELPSNVKEGTFRLEIEFKADEDSESFWECWLPHEVAEPFSVTVLEDGATLTLTCEGCSADEQREVTLRMK